MDWDWSLWIVEMEIVVVVDWQVDFEEVVEGVVAVDFEMDSVAVVVVA